MLKKAGIRFNPDDYLQIMIDESNLDYLLYYESDDMNLITGYTKTDATTKGVTYTWDGDMCHMEGTAESPLSYNNILYSPTELPSIFSEEYTFVYDGVQSALNVIFTDGTTSGWLENNYVRGIKKLKAPENAGGVIIRLFVAEGREVNENVTPMMLSNILGAEGTLEPWFE